VLYELTESGAKIPIRLDGSRASHANAADWLGFDEAIEAFRHLSKAHGIGVILGGRLGGIDLDACLSDGTLAAWAEKWIRRFASYAERSPSGTGVKIFFLMEQRPDPGRNDAGELLVKKARLLGKREPGQLHAPGVELYLGRPEIGGCFFALTFDVVDSCPVEIVQADEAAAEVACFVRGTQLRRSNGHAVPTRVAGPTLHGALPPGLDALLQGDRLLKNAWLAGTKLGGGTDCSASGLDASLTIYLGRKGIDDELIEEALRHYPHGQIGGRSLGLQFAETPLCR
jgi:hypothetical protein